MKQASELRRGVRIEVDGEPYVVVDFSIQTPSARGAATLVKARLRNLRTGQISDRTFRSGDRLAEPDLELRPIQFLYAEGDLFHFMDSETFEQFALERSDLGDAAGYLTEGLEGLRSVVYRGRVINIDLPQAVVLRIEDTEPAIKGATAQAQTKTAVLETGLVIQVPAYLERGEAVEVDTRDARFLGRARR